MIEKKKPTLRWASLFVFFLVLLGSDDADKRAVLTAFVELHNTIYKGVEGVILTHTNVLARIVDGATLTDDDITGDAFLTTEYLDA